MALVALAVPLLAMRQATPRPASHRVGPSGQRPPSGDLPGWHQVFVDDFRKPIRRGRFPQAVSRRWGAYADGWPDSSGHGVYSCSQVCSVRRGVLELYLHTRKGVPQVAAVYPLIRGRTREIGQLYGRYAIRFRADKVPGYHPAWLLWPDSERWPHDGEIDFPEGELSDKICGFVHHQGATDSADQDAFCTQTPFSSGWHTAVIEWTRRHVEFILDGRTIGISRKRIPSTPMHWVIQTVTQFDRKPARRAAGKIEIDWVAVYRRAR